MGPRLEMIRWRADGRVAWSIARRKVFELDTSTASPQFVRVPFRPDLPGLPRAHEATDYGLRVVRVSSQEVRLETATTPEEVLAVHRVLGLNEGDIDISRLTRSPDGTHLAYTVVALAGGTFAAQSRGFLLDTSGRTREPLLLADPLYGPVRWHPTDRLLYAVAEAEDGQIAIFRWAY